MTLTETQLKGKAMKALQLKRALGATALMGLISSAHADVPPAVLTALSDAGEDIATLGAAVFAVIVGIAVWKWFRRTM